METYLDISGLELPVTTAPIDCTPTLDAILDDEDEELDLSKGEGV